MCLHLSPLSEKDRLAFCKINIIFGRNCPLIYKWFRHIAMIIGTMYLSVIRLLRFHLEMGKYVVTNRDVFYVICLCYGLGKGWD